MVKEKNKIICELTLRDEGDPRGDAPPRHRNRGPRAGINHCDAKPGHGSSALAAGVLRAQDSRSAPCQLCPGRKGSHGLPQAGLSQQGLAWPGRDPAVLLPWRPSLIAPLLSWATQTSLSTDRQS